jgi:hypothetical protein
MVLLVIKLVNEFGDNGRDECTPSFVRLHTRKRWAYRGLIVFEDPNVTRGNYSFKYCSHSRILLIKRELSDIMNIASFNPKTNQLFINTNIYIYMRFNLILVINNNGDKKNIHLKNIITFTSRH